MTGMRDLMNDVRAFHEKCGVPVKDECRLPSKERIELRWWLIEEETHELQFELSDAMIPGKDPHNPRSQPEHLAAIAKEIFDVIVVCVGTAVELGIPLDRVWAEGHASNMTKSGDHTRADGKILKGPDYRPPDIHRAIWGAGGEGDNG